MHVAGAKRGISKVNFGFTSYLRKWRVFFLNQSFSVVMQNQSKRELLSVQAKIATERKSDNILMCHASNSQIIRTTYNECMEFRCENLYLNLRVKQFFNL